MSTYINAELRCLVEDRASDCCEYCKMPRAVAFFPHEVDHIIAEKHGGITDAINLAYACWRCNRHKGSDLGSFDPQTGEFSFLFHPRHQSWPEHFNLVNGQILGLTAVGRTTVKLLQFNRPDRRSERQKYIKSFLPHN
jgi:HNH endonuclease